MKFVTTLRSQIAQAVLARMAQGTAGAPLLEIYDGDEPNEMGQTISDTLLSRHVLSNSVGTEDNGVITFGSVADDNGRADGTAGWARQLDRDGAEVAYYVVTQTGGGGGVQLNSLNVLAGLPVVVTSGTFTVGGG